MINSTTELGHVCIGASVDDWPSSQVVEGLVRELKLDGLQAAALRRTFGTISFFKGQIEILEKSIGSYREIERRFARLDKLLDGLEEEVLRNLNLIEHFLAADIERALGKTVAASVPWYLKGTAAKLCLHLIKSLHEPVKQRVMLNKQNRGGRNRDWRRDLVIEKLAESSLSIIGKRATATESRARSGHKSFVSLCHAVFLALGLPTEGLAKAIAAKLAEMKLSSRKAA